MSASPERTDSFDVFNLFDHNIACEIRLQQALENEMLCPFHYFGITDLEIDGEENDLAKFRQLTSDKRVEYILERAEYYGFSGERVKGLIFCSRKDEAKELSKKFNATGRYRTAVLSGDDSQEIIDFGIYRYHRDYSKNYSGTSDQFAPLSGSPQMNYCLMT